MSDMRRREFITLLGGAAAAWPLDALAQHSGNMWRMGFIADGNESFYGALFEGLREYGYEEGRNLIVERRYARGQAERFKEFAAEMVRPNVDVIVVVTTPAALAVMNATKTIPIVHPNAIDPLNTGLIASLAHPGGNLTGGAHDRRSQRKTPANPKDGRAGAVARGGALESRQRRNRIFLERDARCGARAGIDPSIARGARTEGLRSRFCRNRRRTPGRAPRVAGAVTMQQRKEIISFAIEKRLPSMFQERGWAVAGGLMSYGENLPYMYRRAAYFVDRIFHGAKPSDLPVEQATKFDMVINLRTAKAIGFTIPDSILALADEVIE